jgi:hypothetical protein
MSASHFTEEDLAAAKRRRELEEKIDRDDRLTPAARTVGRELLRWVHRDVGYSWISAAKLAKRLSLGARTVARVLPVLERYGYFEGEHRPGQTTRYRAVYEVPTAPRTSAKMSDHLCQKRPNTSAKMAHKTLRENSNKNLSEVSPPPSAAAEAQQRKQAANEERTTVERSPSPDKPATWRSREPNVVAQELATEKLATGLELWTARPSRRTASVAVEQPDVRIITTDQVAAVITDKPIPPTAIDVTPPAEAAMLTPVASEPVCPEWDVCLQFASDWGGSSVDRAVQVVTGMVTNLPIERVHDHFSKVAKLHRSGRKKLALVEQAIAKELSELHPAQGDLFAAPITPSPDVMGLGATSPPCGAAPPPTALVLDLAALRQYAAQIAAWRPDLDGATAQRKATEWTTAAGAKRIGQLFEKVAPRKRSGAAKFAWVEERVANPRPLRQGRRQARGSRS